MANITVTEAGNIGALMTVACQQALDVLKANIVLTRLVAKDVDFSPVALGETINVSYPGEFTAALKVAGTPAAVSVPANGTKVAVKMENHAYVDSIIEDVASTLSSVNLQSTYLDGMVTAIAEKIESDLFGLYSGFSQSVGTSGTNVTAAVIREAAQKLDDAKNPQSDRFLVLKPKDIYALLGDSGLASFFANSRPEAIASGAVGELYGFEIYKSQLVPTVTGTPNSVKNLALHKNAVIFASRPFRPSGIPGTMETTVTDEDSGLSMRMKISDDHAERGYRMSLDVLYGFKELRDAAGVVVLS